MDPALLQSVPLFRDLSAHDRGQVARWADEIDVPADYRLAEEGRFAHEFFVILDGTVEVTKAGERVADLGPGDFFGEIGLIETERRTATVASTSPLRAVVMHQRDFAAMKDEFPQVCERIHDAIRSRMAQG